MATVLCTACDSPSVTQVPQSCVCRCVHLCVHVCVSGLAFCRANYVLVLEPSPVLTFTARLPTDRPPLPRPLPRLDVHVVLRLCCPAKAGNTVRPDISALCSLCSGTSGFNTWSLSEQVESFLYLYVGGKTVIGQTLSQLFNRTGGLTADAMWQLHIVASRVAKSPQQMVLIFELPV